MWWSTGFRSAMTGWLFLVACVDAAEAQSFVPVSTAEQCPADRSPIMILGTYHMANPGLDAVNIEADDVLSERRQAEMADLVNQLARFQPTRVMLEAPYASAVSQQRYERYRSGALELSRNETDQIGFRLAHQMGLEHVNPIDFPMMMSGLTYDEIEFATPPAIDAAPSSSPPRELSEDELRLRRSTVAEYLLYINTQERWRANHLVYMSLFEPEAGNAAIYEASDRMANWYRRNFRMWANVVRKTDRPTDRVFLLVGSGHLAILRSLALDMPGFCLVEPHAYLDRSPG